MFKLILGVLLLSAIGCGSAVRDEISKVNIPAAPDKRGADAAVKLETLAKWREDYNDKLVAAVGNKPAQRKLQEESSAYLKSMAGKTAAGFAQFKRIIVDPDNTTTIQLMYPHDRESGISVKVSRENADKLKNLQPGDEVFSQGVFASDGSFLIIGTVEKK